MGILEVMMRPQTPIEQVEEAARAVKQATEILKKQKEKLV